MYPDPGDALSRTIDYEAALEDLYAEVIRRWSPYVEAAVLPTLGDVLGSLPPDPDAVAETQGRLDHLLDGVILAGLSMIWAHTFIEAQKALDIDPLPARRDRVIEVDKTTTRVVSRGAGVKPSEMLDAVTRVGESVTARAALDEFLDNARETTAALPGIVRDTLTTAIAEAGPELSRAQISLRVKDIIAPSSPEMRDIARRQGYQAAGVMNHAVVAAAKGSDEDLDKVWIATLDGKTRKTHWAADGQRAPLDGTFSVGRDDLRFPGDPRGSAAEVKNCRCRVGVLAKDEAIPDEVDRHTERLDGRDSVAINRGGRSQAEEIKRREDDGNIRARDDPDGIGRVAAGGWTAPSEQEYTMDSTTLADGDTAVTYRTFTDAVIALVGEPTSDGRMLAADIKLSFRDFPLPLMWTKQSSDGHLDAFTVGVLESAEVADGKVLASGYLLNSTEADEAADQIAHGVTGPSVDLAATEWVLTDEAGKEITEADWMDLPPDARVFQTITVAELIGTTLVATPAFGTTTITLDAERSSRDVTLVASAAEDFRPRVYAAGLFADPKLTGPTLPTMDPDSGRIYGHLACFGSCHRSIQTECVMAPRSRTGYAHFHTSPAVRLDDGTRLPVGRLTVGTGHAPDNLRGGPALAHYDNTGTCFALVRVGEDEHGIWFSGVAAPWATPEQVEMGLSAPLSGDWRDFGQGLELIAALAVNTPGFAARGRDDEQGRPVALVASLGPVPERSDATVSLSEIRDVVMKAMIDADRATRFAAERDELLAKAAAITTPPTPRDEVAALLAGR